MTSKGSKGSKSSRRSDKRLAALENALYRTQSSTERSANATKDAANGGGIQFTSSQSMSVRKVGP